MAIVEQLAKYLGIYVVNQKSIALANAIINAYLIISRYRASLALIRLVCPLTSGIVQLEI